MQQAPYPVTQLSLRFADIYLNHFFSGTASGIRYLNPDLNITMVLSCFQWLHLKGRIRKSETKWIIYLFPCTRNGFKVTITDINILHIIHIVPGFMEALRGGIILQRVGKGIRKLAGGIPFS